MNWNLIAHEALGTATIGVIAISALLGQAGCQFLVVGDRLDLDRMLEQFGEVFRNLPKALGRGDRVDTVGHALIHCKYHRGALGPDWDSPKNQSQRTNNLSNIHFHSLLVSTHY